MLVLGFVSAMVAWYSLKQESIEQDQTSMNQKLLILITIFIPAITSAALPPKYQNLKDLNVMTEFVKKHDRIMETLKSIDFKNRQVVYGDDCIASFDRAYKPKPKGWVGPADPLEFKESTCEVE